MFLRFVRLFSLGENFKCSPLESLGNLNILFKEFQISNSGIWEVGAFPIGIGIYICICVCVWESSVTAWNWICTRYLHHLDMQLSICNMQYMQLSICSPPVGNLNNGGIPKWKPSRKLAPPSELIWKRQKIQFCPSLPSSNFGAHINKQTHLYLAFSCFTCKSIWAHMQCVKSYPHTKTKHVSLTLFVWLDKIFKEWIFTKYHFVGLQSTKRDRALMWELRP